jgi:Rrf2 family protein
VDEIAKTYGISRRHITKVVHHLGHRGYLCNVRGKRGRIALGREPSAINIGTLVREREDNLECYRQRGCCLEAVCVLHKALDEALLAFLSVLSRYTLADLLKPDRRLKSLLQIPILASRSAHSKRLTIFVWKHLSRQCCAVSGTISAPEAHRDCSSERLSVGRQAGLFPEDESSANSSHHTWQSGWKDSSKRRSNHCKRFYSWVVYRSSRKQGGHVMRKILLSMCVLSALTATVAAQTKPAAGSNEIYWVITFTVPPGNMDKFKQVVARLVAATKQEPGTLEYEYTATPDNGTVDIIERYADSDAAVHHVADNFGPNFSKEFLALVKPARFVVYGTPSAKAKEVLAGFNPIYMSPFDGFTR